MEDVLEKRLKQMREKKAVSPKKRWQKLLELRRRLFRGMNLEGQNRPLTLRQNLQSTLGLLWDWLCGIEDNGTLTNRKVLEMIGVLSSAAEIRMERHSSALIIFVDSKKLIKYLSEKDRMENLLKEGVIDKELFQLWEEKNNSSIMAR